jgi:hypothetical protein
LVERRASGTAQLLGQVRQALSTTSAEPGPDALTRLRGLLHYASPDDDTCTLAIRVR